MAEVDRLLPAEPKADVDLDRQTLQADHDRYLAQLGAGHSIVVGLRSQLDASAPQESQSAIAVKQAKALLDLLEWGDACWGSGRRCARVW